ncbi:MAG: DNA alkylation repair protein [Terriglobia bacterium]
MARKLATTATLAEARKTLWRYASPAKALTYRSFFKNSQDDVFLGVTAPLVRKVAIAFPNLTFSNLLTLMQSNVHEERSLAHAILRLRFMQGDERERARVFRFYMAHRRCIRAWDGVDDSAPYIVGPYLLEREKDCLYALARSKRIWDRRIAIVSTWWFIRKGRKDQTSETFKIAEMLLGDEEGLIHKAVGWMLREAGKRDLGALKRFLKSHYQTMPRTMLRYAIERFPADERQRYLRPKTGQTA